MTKIEFIKTLDCVRINQKFRGMPELIEFQGVKELTEAELDLLLDELVNFNVNNLWDKKYMGLGIEESICAVARPLQDRLLYTLREANKIEVMTKIHYSSDVNIEDYANLVVFDNEDGEKCAIFIDRLPNDTVMVSTVELFEKPSDAWVNEYDLMVINESCDSNYKFDKPLNEYEQYLFTSDLCWYYGAVNFDSNPMILSQDAFESYLETNNLI